MVILELRWAFGTVEEGILHYPRNVGLRTVILEGLNRSVEQGLRVVAYAVVVYDLLASV